MQTMTIFCDRCGKQLENTNDMIAVKNWTKHYYTYNAGETVSYDLCPECRKDFGKFLKNNHK